MICGVNTSCICMVGHGRDVGWDIVLHLALHGIFSYIGALSPFQYAISIDVVIGFLKNILPYHCQCMWGFGSIIVHERAS